ncbi:hypothetical protein [Nonomuraea wenchangensis]|uniref:hypothetical protein n=1 Tax=Nonomuraea wenchangensis TaxID=568860 RepID=UPI0033C3A550
MISRAVRTQARATAGEKHLSVYLPVTRDLSPLMAHRESLVALILTGDLTESAARTVRRLTALTQITLGQVAEIGFLSDLRNLTSVSLHDASQIADFSSLKISSAGGSSERRRSWG